ncbi:hypothetical protein NE236_42035 [Actinoallomurus purpureus]|uniref:hypothetical protein n=1 Tax=Actinoallomurus purpureus TaxID=478114 RepID=UPI002093130C|nr:hypothetical protein [Actinoallomurus purpureus]MCO6011552.1 hypothetical protein [Actinoallomurus purpureus]
MTTAHQEAAASAVLDFASDPAGARAMRTYIAGLKAGQWPAAYVNAIGQDSLLDSSRWPMEQMYAFARVHSMLMAGEISQVQISTAGQPAADENRSENQRRLDDLLGPFVATVDPGQGTDVIGDGWLEWTEPIQVEQSMGVPYIDLATGEEAPLLKVATAPPGRVPLEIGTTHASKTFEHLMRMRGVARWPYGSDRIRLFVRTRARRSLT